MYKPWNRGSLRSLRIPISHWDCGTGGTVDKYLWDRGSLKISESHWDCGTGLQT